MKINLTVLGKNIDFSFFWLLSHMAKKSQVLQNNEKEIVSFYWAAVMDWMQ